MGWCASLPSKSPGWSRIPQAEGRSKRWTGSRLLRPKAADFCYQRTTLRPRAENAESGLTGGRANTHRRSTPRAAFQPLRDFATWVEPYEDHRVRHPPKALPQNAIPRPPAVAKAVSLGRPRPARADVRSRYDLSLRGGPTRQFPGPTRQTISRPRLLPGFRGSREKRVTDPPPKAGGFSVALGGGAELKAGLRVRPLPGN
jgi:hypothetical protein